MKSLRLWVALLACGLVGPWTGCSDDSGEEKPKDDGGPAVVGDAKADGFKLPEGYQLHECKTPGQSCNAHDFCAIDPVCGDDHLCYPTGLQDCDDGLECTEDVCQGLGECGHQPKEGFCVLPVKMDDGQGGTTTELRCFADGERNPSDPCLVCNTKVEEDGDQESWGLANGGACDDGNPCTKDDYCQMGVCKGADYSQECADEFSCTKDSCDGQGGCGQPQLMEDWCLINGECYGDGQRDESGCYLCDPSQTQSQWTDIGKKCTIDSKCYLPGETDSTGCGECDPLKDATDWTLKDGVCKIGSYCYQAGERNSGDCAECNPAVNDSGWTVDSDKCLIEGSWSSTCYDDGDESYNGCSVCDPSASQDQWTTLPNQCLIDDECFAKDDTDDTGCGVCDPAISTNSWVVTAEDKCLIDEECYDAEDLDAETNCNKCDPATDKYSWTPLANKCFIGQTCHDDQGTDPSGCLVCNYAQNPKTWGAAPDVNVIQMGFEDALDPPDGWTIQNSGTSVGWNVSDRRPWDGSYSLYYGNPLTGDYDNGDINTGTAKMPPITLTAGKKAGLSFLLWMDTETSEYWDKLEVIVGTDVLWQKNSSTLPSMRDWHEITVDLSAYAGQSIEITFSFDTDDDTINDTEGVYLDNITVYENC